MKPIKIVLILTVHPCSGDYNADETAFTYCT